MLTENDPSYVKCSFGTDITKSYVEVNFSKMMHGSFFADHNFRLCSFSAYVIQKAVRKRFATRFSCSAVYNLQLVVYSTLVNTVTDAV